MERYPIGATALMRVELRRLGEADDPASWSVCILSDGGDASVRLPAHYAGELAARLDDGAAALAAGLDGGLERTHRDEFVDLTAVEQDGESWLVISSSARSPFRVSVRVDADEAPALAALLDRASEVADTLRQGISLVPDRLPEDFAADT